MSRGVRITGGAWRGRTAMVPAGARPTEGRVREALFSIWCDRLAGCRFLDLFAGSGVVGLEAASRGAGSVLCVDQDAQAVRAIAAIRWPGGAAPATVEARCLALPAGLGSLAARTARTGPVAGGPKRAAAGATGFDLVFADPPYSFEEFEPLLLALPPLLAAGGEVAVEHSARRTLPASAGPLAQTDLRRYGESAVAFYRSPLGTPIRATSAAS